MLAFLIGFHFEACIGAVGFWLLEVTSLLYIVNTLNYLVSGHMFPIDLLGDRLAAVLKALPDKKIILGVIDLASHEVESPEVVASRIRRALPYVEAANLLVAPDCGMKYLPREVAFGKLKAMVAGARLVRGELEGSDVAPGTGVNS